MTKHVAKPHKATKVKHPDKPEAWQPIDSAPALTPVYVRVEGKKIEAILDAHWYICVDGKPMVDHIIHNPTHWMPLK